MKKILSIILLLSCLLGIMACGTVSEVIGGDDNEEEEEVDSFTKFENAIAAASASAVELDVVTNTALGELVSSYEIFYNADGSAVVNYSYQRFYEIGEGAANETVETVSGTVYRDKDGKLSGDTTASLDLSAVTAAAAFEISSFRSVALINEAGDVLTVRVPKTSTANVFGVEFGGDVDFEMILINDKLASMTLTSSDGSSMSYKYSAN